LAEVAPRTLLFAVIVSQSWKASFVAGALSYVNNLNTMGGKTFHGFVL
jgi:hypothetical protein